MKTIKIKRKISSTLLSHSDQYLGIKELEKFKGKSVEIKLDINELNIDNKKEIHNLAGIFSQYADIDHFRSEKQAWAIAVKEKHENYRR